MFVNNLLLVILVYSTFLIDIRPPGNLLFRLGDVLEREDRQNPLWFAETGPAESPSPHYG
jgi:hypothetical protein